MAASDLCSLIIQVLNVFDHQQKQYISFSFNSSIFNEQWYQNFQQQATIV